MKVLMAAVPQEGHVYPLRLLTKAFAEQGHEVIFASGLDVGTLAADTGATVRQTGDDMMTWWQTLAARTRGAPGDGLPPERILQYFLPRLFAEVGAANMVDDLLALAREFRPDVVVHDTFCFAAPLVAELLGVPVVHHMIGPAVPPLPLELCTDAVSPLWRSFDHDVPPFAGLYSGTTLSICPDSLNGELPDSIGNVRPMRPTPLPLESDAAPLPAVLRDLPDRPTIYVTLGTVSNTDTAIFRAALDGLADEPLNVVLTVGSNNDPAAFAPVPENARIERFVEQRALLPHCTAVIHHAGSGTMFGALAHGLPQVAIPQGADNFVNAEVLARSGCAIELSPGGITAETLSTAVRTILDDETYRATARRIATEIAAMPPATAVAQELAERLG